MMVLSSLAVLRSSIHLDTMVKLVVDPVVFDASACGPKFHAKEVVVVPVYNQVSHDDETLHSVVVADDD